jgi:hypothetical protein
MATDAFHVHEEKGDPGRIAIVLPGQAYTAQGPLLSYATHALLDAGWTVRVLIWDVAQPRGAREVYADTLRDSVREHPEARHLVVAKSLGTLALPVASELGMPGAWLTPLLEGPAAPPLRTAIRELVTSGVPTLLAGGTGDSLWSTEHAQASGARVLDIAGADHSLEVPGQWRASLLVFGVVGYVFKKLDYPLAPMVLAIVLGDRMEDAFRQSMLSSQGALGIFWHNGLSGTITTLALLMLVWPLLGKLRAMAFGRRAVAS